MCCAVDAAVVAESTRQQLEKLLGQKEEAIELIGSELQSSQLAERELQETLVPTSAMALGSNSYWAVRRL